MIKCGYHLAFLLVMSGLWTALPDALNANGSSENLQRGWVELVNNGGCEADLIGGNIPAWVEVVGAVWTQRSSNPEPYEGEHYFFAGAGASAELRQDADLAAYAGLVDNGNQSFVFDAYVRSWDQSPADISQLILEFLNHDKSQILASHDFGQHSNTSAWVHLTHSRLAPVGTRYIRIRLISIRRSGNNNDGYFDAISLRTYIPELPAPQNLEISTLGNDLFLSWDPVTQDSAGNPVTISNYMVYAADYPDFVCNTATFVGSVTDPQILLPGWAGMHDKGFFAVRAVE